ncbi:hypothetical protein HB834_16715, partial [Listeria booriae]|uniref:lantibiotic dehydratase n=1 Tax=Listeria booriae TaxID=1552123 RepID=UPI00164D5947
WSDLRCYFFGDKQFELFLKKLNSYKMKSELNRKLKEIQLLMEEYSRTEIGEGTGLIKIIQEKMKSLVSKKRYIHIDSTRDIDTCKLNQIRISEDLTGFLEFLSQHTFKLSAFRTSNVVNSFIEKYGDTEVPLKIFTDENNLERFFEDNYMLQEEINIREVVSTIRISKYRGRITDF